MRPVTVITALLERAVLRMRMGTVVVPVRAVVRERLNLVARAFLVMPESHALPRRDRGQSLDRYGQGQQQHRKKSAESLRHRRAL